MTVISDLRTVRLHKYALRNAVLGYGVFYLTELRHLDPYKYDELESTTYDLPDGYTLGYDPLGILRIFDPKGRSCIIVTDKHDHPQLCSGTDNNPMLVPSASQA